MEIDPITLKRLNPLICGILVAAFIPYMKQMFNINLWVYRKLGWSKVAAKYESSEDSWIRMNRWICGILAVSLVLAAIFFPDSWAQYFRIP
jgi:hypothetical protein